MLSIVSHHQPIIDTNEISRVREKHKDRVPCIVQIKGKNTPTLTKSKYLVPLDLTFGQFIQIVRKYFSKELSSTDGLFWFINNEIITPSKLMSQIDKEYSKDGALYIQVSVENTFGTL